MNEKKQIMRADLRRFSQRMEAADEEASQIQATQEQSDKIDHRSVWSRAKSLILRKKQARAFSPEEADVLIKELDKQEKIEEVDVLIKELDKQRKFEGVEDLNAFYEVFSKLSSSEREHFKDAIVSKLVDLFRSDVSILNNGLELAEFRNDQLDIIMHSDTEFNSAVEEALSIVIKSRIDEIDDAAYQETMTAFFSEQGRPVLIDLDTLHGIISNGLDRMEIARDFKENPRVAIYQEFLDRLPDRRELSKSTVLDVVAKALIGLFQNSRGFFPMGKSELFNGEPVIERLKARLMQQNGEGLRKIMESVENAEKMN